jgi:hypothetical protein
MNIKVYNAYACKNVIVNICTFENGVYGGISWLIMRNTKAKGKLAFIYKKLEQIHIWVVEVAWLVIS